jgi:hypothetical protein
MVLAGLGFAQESNFASGPQYLVLGSPLFARSLATPTLSFGSLPPGPPPFPEPPQAEPATFTSTPELQGQANLYPIFYGVPQESVIEVSYAEISEIKRPLPGSLTDVGVSGVMDAPTLRSRALGVSLGEAAKYWRSHKGPAASRHFTNDDIERLHAH